MKENYEKYATLLLKKCLNIQKGQPLLISIPIECYEFLRVLTLKAYELGVTDIYIDYEDEELKHQQLECLTTKELKQSPYFQKEIYNEYAKKEAAILMLRGENPDKMKDIDSNLIAQMQKHLKESYQEYRKKQRKYEISWCIACVGTKGLGHKIFKNSKTPDLDLWNQIFEICHIKDKDPNAYWDQLIERNNQRTQWLESLSIKSLHYQNRLGTDLTIGLNPKTKWFGTEKQSKRGTIIVNMPGEEVFTSPLKNETNGIVYSSKPLVYEGVTITNFSLTFKNGQVQTIQAEQGEDVLKKIITQTPNANMLGEVALVDYHSPISESGIIYYNTLYDENASCHLALGDGFVDTIEAYESKSEEELEALGLNRSKEHVDFMIGTDDLSIIATLTSGEKVTIFQDGDFVTIS